MTTNTDAQIRHVFEQWHETTIKCDLAGLMALYADDAVFESPAVFALSGNADGILRGKAALTAYFELFFRKLGQNVVEWYRTGEYFTDGTTLSWEYPRETPRGSQVDLIEQMTIQHGRIVHHRVYWGWVGFKTLLDNLAQPK